jgi:hypothetical protein
MNAPPDSRNARAGVPGVGNGSANANRDWQTSNRTKASSGQDGPAELLRFIGDLEALAERRDELNARIAYSGFLVQTGRPDPGFHQLQKDVGDWVHGSTALMSGMAKWGRQ